MRVGGDLKLFADRRRRTTIILMRVGLLSLILLLLKEIA
jgi:hypothetical protein